MLYNITTKILMLTTIIAPAIAVRLQKSKTLKKWKNENHFKKIAWIWDIKILKNIALHLETTQQPIVKP